MPLLRLSICRTSLSGLCTASINSRPTSLLQVASQQAARARSFSERRKENKQSFEKQERKPETSTEDLKAAGASLRLNIGPLFTGLLVVGIGLTGYGLYTIYNIMTIWPPEIKRYLRSGLLAKRKGDLDGAVLYLSKAWERTKSSPISVFDEDPLLKTTGVAIALAGVLEDARKPQEAYKVYEDAFLHLWTANQAALVSKSSSSSSSNSKDLPDLLHDTLGSLTNAEKLRAVSIAYKLAALAHDLQELHPEEEKWLVWCVTTLVRERGLGEAEASTSNSPSSQRGLNSQPKDELTELTSSMMPLQSFAAPFEALGSLYARTGRPQFAVAAYLQAITILIPPERRIALVSAEDACRGAQSMGNIAQLLIDQHPSDAVPPDILEQASAWMKKGLEVTTVARKRTSEKDSSEGVCELVYAVLLFNLAMIREFSGDKEAARKLFGQSLEHAKARGAEVAVIAEVEKALRALEIQSNSSNP